MLSQRISELRVVVKQCGNCFSLEHLLKKTGIPNYSVPLCTKEHTIMSNHFYSKINVVLVARFRECTPGRELQPKQVAMGRQL